MLINVKSWKFIWSFQLFSLSLHCKQKVKQLKDKNMDKLSFKDIKELEPLKKNDSKIDLFNVKLSNEDESKYAIIDEDGNVIYRHNIDFTRPVIHFDKVIELDPFSRNNELIDLNGNLILKSEHIYVRGKLVSDGSKLINLDTLEKIDTDIDLCHRCYSAFGYSTTSNCHFVKNANRINIYDENLKFLYSIDLLPFGNNCEITFNSYFIILHCGNEKKAIIFEKDNCKIIDDLKDSKYRIYEEKILVYTFSNQLIIYNLAKRRNIRVFDNVDSPIFYSTQKFLYFTCANNYTYIVDATTGKILKTFKARIVPSFCCEKCTLTWRESDVYHGNLLLVKNEHYKYNLLYTETNSLLLSESIYSIKSAYRNVDGWSFQIDPKHSFAVKDYFFRGWHSRNEKSFPLAVKGKNLMFKSKVIY